MAAALGAATPSSTLAMQSPLRSNGSDPPPTSWLLLNASAAELSQSTKKLNRNFGTGTLGPLGRSTSSRGLHVRGALVRANDPLLWRINDLRTGGLLLCGRHIGGLTASIGTPHTFFDAALNRTSAFLLKPKAGTDVALAGLFALLAGFVSESLCIRQVVLGRSSVPILVIKVLNRSVVIVVILRRCSLHRNQQQTCKKRHFHFLFCQLPSFC